MDPPTFGKGMALSRLLVSPEQTGLFFDADFCIKFRVSGTIRNLSLLGRSRGQPPYADTRCMYKIRDVPNKESKLMTQIISLGFFV